MMNAQASAGLHQPISKPLGRLWWAVGAAVLCLGGPAGAAVSPAGTNAPAPPAGLSFGLDKVELLQWELLGHPLWKYVASLLCIVLALVLVKAIDWCVNWALRAWAARTATKLDDLLLELTRTPIKVVAFAVLLHFGLRIFTWPDWTVRAMSVGLQIVVAVSLTYMLLKAVDIIVGYWQRTLSREGDRPYDKLLFPLLRKSMKILVAVTAALVTTQNLGIDITGMIAVGSVGGLALGLAAQDTLANWFGALSVFVDKPFHIGDYIKIDGFEGEVEAIGLRSTRLRNPDGHFITVPNKTMGSATITNITRRPHVKTQMNIGLTYDTPPDQVKRAVEILENIYRKHPQTHDVWITFDKFDSSALNLQVIHWWKGAERKAYLQGMHEFNLAILKRFTEAQINMAFPTQTLNLRQDSKWRLTRDSTLS